MKDEWTDYEQKQIKEFTKRGELLKLLHPSQKKNHFDTLVNLCAIKASIFQTLYDEVTAIRRTRNKLIHSQNPGKILDTEIEKMRKGKKGS